MIELVHAVIAHVGIAGLVGIWIVKAGVGALGVRWFKTRKGTRG